LSKLLHNKNLPTWTTTGQLSRQKTLDKKLDDTCRLVMFNLRKPFGNARIWLPSRDNSRRNLKD